MNTAIVYASKYGTTAACAQKVADQLNGETALFDLKKTRSVDLSAYSCVIIGGPIYAGKMPSSVRRFCEKHRSQLSKITVGLFICCLHEGEKALEQVESNYPPWLLSRSIANEWFGGAVSLAALRKVDKFIITRLAKMTEDVEKVLPDRISSFVQKMNAAMEAVD